MKASDNTGKIYEIKKNGTDIIIPKEQISTDIDYIDITDDTFEADCGENGWYAIADVEHRGSYLCKFTDKKDYEFVTKQDLMPIFGIKKQDICLLGIVEGMKQNFYAVVGVKNGRYYFKLRFEITEFGATEDIRVKLLYLDNSCGYSEMAAKYRKYQLDNGNCVPIKDRLKSNNELEYAVQAPEIRIRLGWKPAPPTVLEQTEENEPEMKVACTFDRVMDIIDELKNQGVDKAQLCLIGWNKSGHDGRYPQLFPVEEKLGGEEKLKELISYAQKNGYQIVCHTNSTDCYSIADTFSENIVCKKIDGRLSINEPPWSGGNMYHLCPIVAWDYAKNDLPKVSELGFKGLHYIDVMSVVPLRECYDKNHLSNKSQTLEYYEKIMKLCHQQFGGFASEGAFDFTSKYLDYALYVSWGGLDDDFFDEEIPLWQLVYNGIILSNPSTATVNCTIKGNKSKLKLIEYGGRPTFYIYSKFLNGSNQDNWLGADDLICDTDEQLKYSVSKIKEGYELYKDLVSLQTEFMEKHEEIDDNVFKITYSDGSVILVDYNKMQFRRETLNNS